MCTQYQSQLDHIVAASRTLKPFCEKLKATSSGEIGIGMQDRSISSLKLDILHLLASLLALSCHRCDKDANPTGKPDKVMTYRPVVLAHDESRDLQAKLQKSGSLPMFQRLPRPNEATIRSPVDAFLEGKVAVVEPRKDKIWCVIISCMTDLL